MALGTEGTIQGLSLDVCLTRFNNTLHFQSELVCHSVTVMTKSSASQNILRRQPEDAHYCSSPALTHNDSNIQGVSDWLNEVLALGYNTSPPHPENRLSNTGLKS